jgi:hypothetical protein
MKINELLNEAEQLDELEPGQTPAFYDPRRYFGQGRKNIQTLKQDKQLSKNLYNAWNAYAVRINRALANDPELVAKSAGYFKSFISKALKIPPGNPMFQEIDNILGTNGMNYNKATAQKALDYAVAQRAMATLDTPSRSGAGRSGRGGPPSIVSGQTAKAGGVEYVWNGSEWRNGATGAVATAPISAALTASLTGGNP